MSAPEPRASVSTRGPVLIVGTGLLGTSLALALRAAGVDVGFAMAGDGSHYSRKLRQLAGNAVANLDICTSVGCLFNHSAHEITPEGRAFFAVEVQMLPVGGVKCNALHPNEDRAWLQLWCFNVLHRCG